MVIKSLGQPPGLETDGPKLRRIRERRGVTAVAVARAMGRSRKTVDRAERSEPIRKATAWQIANALSRVGEPVRPWDFIPSWPEDEIEPDRPEALAS